MSESTEKAAEKPVAHGDQKCSVEGCKRPYRAKTYCVSHYQKWRRGEMDEHKARYKLCSKEACKKVAGRWGLCEEHGAKAAPAEAPPAA